MFCSQAAKAREAAAEKAAAMPPANVGPSFSLEELGPKRSKERKMERSDKGGKKVVRTAGGQTWEDSSLQDWPDGKIIYPHPFPLFLNSYSILWLIHS